MSNRADVITVELVDGTKIIVPDSLDQITSYVLREQADWFEDEIKFLRRLVQAGDIVVDIGANYGVYALSLARKVGPSGQLWAFEPASETAQLLTASAGTNGTSWLHVVQQAVSDREGMAWLQTPGQSELNTLTTADGDGSSRGPGESVAVTTLDHCLERFGWTAVDLLKIDAEGAEESILRGGARFFQELSPLVMYEVKAGTELHLELVQRFAELGYQSFHLIPGLDVLVPFSAGQDADGYLLNLFAAKPDRAADLAASGWLIPDVDAIRIAVDDEASARWLQVLQGLPYARSLVAGWQGLVLSEEQEAIRRALGAWSCAQDGSAPLVKRYAALIESHAILQAYCQPGSPAVRWASLARVARAVGKRVEAVQALNAMLTELQTGRKLAVEEPFLCPDPACEAIEPIGSMQAWLEAAGLVALEQAGSYSGFYTGETAWPRLERVLSLGYQLETIQRRHQLIQARFDGMRPTADARSSVRDWFNFLGLKDPIRCLDVGALGLSGETEPWVLWAQAGCAEVLGFEPLKEECDQLNLKAQHSGAAIRYLPWALGDGLEHTLYITNAPMTSSLFPPARSTVDLFPALGELMQVEQRMQVQTHRLDDLEEAAGTDFLKLDVQGAELMILENARDCLKSVSVIQCEVEFVELYAGQPLMADVDAFLRSQGFCFLRYVYMMGRPFKPLKRADSPYAAISQTLWADALYVRDFRRMDRWSERQLRAGAFILHEAYEAYDLALLILQELNRRGAGELSSCYATALMLLAEGKLLIDGCEGSG